MHFHALSTSCPAAVIFTADIITTLCTGLVIVHNLRQAVVMDRKIVAKHYLLHGTLSIDIIATGPLWVEVREVVHVQMLHLLRSRNSSIRQCGM